MKDLLAVIGAGCLFFSTMLVLLGVLHERADRKSRARQQASREQLEHVRRFSAVQAVLDLDAYRARKANAPSGRQDPVSASRSVAEAANPRAESLTPVGVPRNA